MKKVLFVCLGNICRSPTAEAVMVQYIKDEGLSEQILCDSAGTSAYHEGEQADHRMRTHGAQRGYDLTSISRKFIAKDFQDFDYIIAMDDANFADICSLDPGEQHTHQVHRMTDFCTHFTEHKGVPDPYYGGDQGFETVIDIIEDGCRNLLKKIQKDGI